MPERKKQTEKNLPKNPKWWSYKLIEAQASVASMDTTPLVLETKESGLHLISLMNMIVLYMSSFYLLVASVNAFIKVVT